MKLWIKIALGALTGFAGGFAAGFVTHKKMNDVEFEEISNEEMAVIENSMQATPQQDAPAKEPENGISVHGRVMTDDDLPTDPDKLRINMQGKISYIQADNEAKEKYSRIWDTVNGYSNPENANELPIPAVEEDPDANVSEDEFDTEFIDQISSEDEATEGFSSSGIYEIGLVDFYDATNGFDKITIDWYEPDVFLDEHEEVIADISTYIGDIDIEKLFAYKDSAEDDDTRFIRNEGYSTDYEITRHHRTWTETIGGSE